ncbi:hypothetical protein CHLRE_12g524200v5 [Chlamydomonas reinhardtii]|uniref:Signal peptidase complex subunit 2 n=1 Tax=Chlamydomonas reinhardtii TaxID=3055 RepID=A0A2K3D4B9_CHLRE|nr:uncharacterized protein CHLRE_12g524200v5 [Chlamydomonas reinhardtii]PNW75367.1 hypothetical protein CHLRE_12g524200v5 [Chlamydomonas reinhardtii]
MGRAKPAAAKAASPAKPAEEDAPEPIKLTNLYDAGALKGALDEVAREVVLDAGFNEDVMVSNIKLLLGFTAIGSGLLAQFGPGKFPANWWMVFGCVVAYLVLTTLLNLYSWKVEGEAFLVTRPFRGGKGVRVSSRMGRWSDEFTLVITDREDPSLEVTSQHAIPEFFHSNGYMADGAWRAAVEKLTSSYLERLAARRGKKDD